MWSRSRTAIASRAKSSYLERGRLEFKTDDAGTLLLEWDKVASLVATRLFEVILADGRRYLGSLGSGEPRSLAIVEPQQTTRLQMADVTHIWPIGSNFWRRIDGSIDAGFSYTRSSGVAQLNLNSDTVFRAPAFETRVTLSLTTTQKNDGSGRDDRGALEASHLRYPWRRWFIAGAARFERNESLGIELRSQLAGAAGPRLINNNRGQLAIGAGLVVNDERGVDVEATQNVEGLLLFRSSFHTYDRPTTTFDTALQYLSQPQRSRTPPGTTRRRHQAGSLEGPVRVGERLQQLRQPAAEPGVQHQRHWDRVLGWLDVLKVPGPTGIYSWTAQARSHHVGSSCQRLGWCEDVAREPTGAAGS